MCFKFSSTLECLIDMQNEINVQVEKFLKGIKRINVNMQDRIDMQGNFFLKINKHADQNKTMQGEFFLKSTPKTLPIEKTKKIPKHIQSIPKALPKALPKHYQTTPKQDRIVWKEVCLIHTGPIPITCRME